MSALCGGGMQPTGMPRAGMQRSEAGLSMRSARNAVMAVAAATLCVLLTACDGQPNNTVPAPMPVPTQSSSASPTATPEPKPGPDPTMLPGGTALANRDYFDFVNLRLLSINANPSSEAIVENLQNAGFAKADLEVTADSTPVISRPADSIQVGVRTSEGCLLGQFKAGSYSSAVGPTLNGGACLIGETETIR